MGADSKIEWTHHTFSPWWGCAKVSEGCLRCYAEAWAKRTGHGVWGEKAARRFFGENHWREPLRWNADAAASGERKRVFCSSMADVFEDREDLVWPRAKLFRMIEATPALDWLLLTKRPENMTRLAAQAGWREMWPFNVWAGATAENQERLVERWRRLAPVRARVHFLSCEPLLGPIELVCNGCDGNVRDHLAPDQGGCSAWFPDLIIAGAESGHGARSMNEQWVKSLRDQCALSGGRIKFFYKQKLDERGRKVGLPMLDGRQWSEMPS